MKSLDTVASAALQRCSVEGACSETPEADGPPRAGERVLEGPAWTGYVDAPFTPTGDLACRPIATPVAELKPATPNGGFVAVRVPVNANPLPHWTLRCDRPGCGATLAGTGRTDSDVRRAVTLRAEAEGWQISRWRDVPVDLCPEHAVPEWAEGPPRSTRPDALGPLVLELEARAAAERRRGGR